MTWDSDGHDDHVSDGTFEHAYRQHLTSGDLALLAEVAPRRPLSVALASPELERVVFAPAQEFDPAHTASPFLTFAVAVHRMSERLAAVTYVNEWVGPRQRVPVFGVDRLRELLADPLRRFFFVELLGSYTHVASGTMWTATRRGWRRRRFSELDPLQLVALLEAVPATERPGVLRRLGDLALFLTGVFPDHTATTPLGRPSAPLPLLRSAGLDPTHREEVAANAFELLELLGARWYRLAAQLSPAPSGSVRALGAIAEGFSDARRVLNVVTDTYLFPVREQWFGRPAA
jgi:hypothetical protein